ncbi:MAG: glycerophosphodiester phosphodiesterase [Gammaproteobacteria bacterium]|nr:MAG: glycerophosphodiester phosphodiesterase [Gammaproteobacteria bacterium]
MPQRAAPSIVIAHRGASAYLPEHSLAGKAMAHAQGADYLEQDVVATGDGVPIVFHDLYLDALTDVASRFPGRARADGHYYCVDFELEEIRSLGLHERIDPASGRPRFPGRFPPEAARFRIPTLAEELAFIRGLNHSTGREAGIYPELKAPAWHRQQGIELAPLVLAELDAAGYLAPGQKVFLQCFDADELRRLRPALPAGLPLIQLLDRQALRSLDLQAIAAYAQGIGPPLTALADFGARPPRATGLRAAAAAAGLAVHAWTVRCDALPEGAGNLDALLRMLCGRLRVEGLFTDFPDRVRDWLAQEPG